MVDRDTVRGWLDRYVAAWKSYDAEAIGDLFTEDATYASGPFDEPVRGREAIVASWLEEPDEPGTYDGRYEPIAVDGDVAVANGRSRYFEADGATLASEFDKIFVLELDAAGRCAEYREWYIERPTGEG